MKSAPPMFLLCLATLSALAASTPTLADPGRLFYTPEERVRLEALRARGPQAAAAQANAGLSAPRRYDGIVVRSDGRVTRWVDGHAQVGASGIAGLKPGQVRAEGKVYEPYQILPPAPARESAP